MSNVKSFTVGNATYNAVMASAVKQDELLSLLTGTIMERGLAAMRLGGELDDRVLVPMFMSLPYDVKTRAAAILMGQVVVHVVRSRLLWIRSRVRWSITPRWW